VLQKSVDTCTLLKTFQIAAMISAGRVASQGALKLRVTVREFRGIQKMVGQHFSHGESISLERTSPALPEIEEKAKGV
jgi:hypothetical protein